MRGRLEHAGDEAAQAARRFVTAADQVGLSAWAYDLTTDLTLPSQAFCALFGQASEPGVVVPSDPFRSCIHPDDVAHVDGAFRHAATRTEPEVCFTHRLLRSGEEEADGVRWLRAKGRVLGVGDGEVGALFVGTVIDVTEERRPAERLATLNQEASHRIKNNLSMIASMLILEGGAASNATTRHRFERAAERVRAIANIHDLVAGANGSELIDFGDYLSSLCRAASRAVERDGVEVICEGTSVTLHVDTCVSLALLVNEYVTNAVQHAFPAGRSGCVAVSAGRQSVTSGEALVIEVADDGVGKVAGSEGSVGTLVTQSIARQVGATVTERDGDPGHVVTVALPLVSYR